jgi:hypothetical protein
LLERDTFDLFLPEIDKPWVIHLRELAAVLQTSALGGPTLSTKIEAFIDINHHHPLGGRKIITTQAMKLHCISLICSKLC